jgi:uncharacterized protein involved in oxidation of intracellular sulfur
MKRLQLGVLLATTDPESARTAFRSANTALEAGHAVETFLLGGGVEAPDLERWAVSPH